MLGMADDSRGKTIEEILIGRNLDSFITSFNSICEAKSLPYTPDALSHLAQEGKIPGVIELFSV